MLYIDTPWLPHTPTDVLSSPSWPYSWAVALFCTCLVLCWPCVLEPKGSPHLRMKPPLMAICSRSSTTRAGWLFTTPSWLLPQALLPPLFILHWSQGEYERWGDRKASVWAELLPTQTSNAKKNNTTVFKCWTARQAMTRTSSISPISSIYCRHETYTACSPKHRLLFKRWKTRVH